MSTSFGSKIYLCTGVPFKNDYLDTLYFSSATKQTSYFSGLVTHTFTSQSYQRWSKNSLRIQVLCDDIYDCNYMMFQNTSYGSKWFYAFITDIEYVNDVTTEVYYEIDVIQTYFFDITFKQCYIKRMHADSDDLGDNLEPEPVSFDCDYVYQSPDKSAKIGADYYSGIDDCSLIVDFANVSGSDQYAAGQYDGVMCGAFKAGFENTDDGIDDLTDFLNNNFTTDPDSIIAIYMCPSFLISYYSSGSKLHDYAVYQSDSGTSVEVEGNALDTDNMALNGYTPYNMKMWTYPYNYFYVSNGTDGMIMKYEYMSDKATPTFQIFGTKIPPVSLVLRPKGYHNTGTTYHQYDVSMSLTIDDFPTCSWASDTYLAWYAQTSATYGYKVGQVALGLIGNTVSSTPTTTTTYSDSGNPQTTVSSSSNATGSFLSAAGSMLGTTLDLLAQEKTAKIAADSVSGNVSSSALMCNNQRVFTGIRMCVPKETAKKIDLFFQMYGYAQNTVGTPNRHVRSKWTFIQTDHCNVIGDCNSQVLSLIAQIHDRGIRYWTSASYIGNYTQSNDIV